MRVRICPSVTVFFIVLIIAVANLALGIALAIYFDPARETEMELVAPTLTAEAPTVEDHAEEAQQHENPEPHEEEIVAESPEEEAAQVGEIPLDPEVVTASDEPPHDESKERRNPRREQSVCEVPLNEFREHVNSYWGLLCDMDSRLHAPDEGFDKDEVTKLATVLIRFNEEVDGHLNQMLNELDALRDSWDEASHAIESFVSNLRALKHEMETIDEELGRLEALEDVALAKQTLHALLSRCADQCFAIRDRLESARCELIFDCGLHDQLLPEELLSSHKGVLNRIGIELKIRQWREKETSRTRPYSLAVIGVDNMPELNDTLGILTADIVLGHVADLTLDAIRGEDCLGHYAGSRYLLFFPETGPATATNFLEHMRQSLEAMRFEHEGTTISVTASCGLVEGDPDDAIDALAISAMETMETARGEGGNRTMVLEKGEPTSITPPDFGAESKTIAV